MNNSRQCKVCVYILVCAMLLSFVHEKSVMAVSKYRLNCKKLTLKLKGSYTLKVYGAKKKVKWKSSNKKIASVISKGKVKAKIKAKKVGRCKVYAKIGNKKLICKVIVIQRNTNDTSNSNKSDTKKVSEDQKSQNPDVTPTKEPIKQKPTVAPTK